MHFTNLPANATNEKKIWAEWEDSSSVPISQSIQISQVTFQRRKQLKSSIDKFANFSWNSLDAFKNFGIFIINDKNSLKFYNGAGYSNEYTSPQFADSTILSGVTFKTQTISFKIGIYWFSIEEYRRILNWLNPYIIDNLSFDFNQQFYYQVKLNGREDSIRYIIGYEDNEPRYYTEMTLNFDVQGSSCARAVESYVWKINNDNLSTGELQIYFDSNNTGVNSLISDYDIPFKLTIPITLASNISDGIQIECDFLWGDHHQINLFNIALKNLPLSDNTNSSNPKILYLEYDSESGLIYQKFGDGQYKILNRLNNLNGEQLVDFMTINKFMIPGAFNYPQFGLKDAKIDLIFKNFNTINNSSGNLLDLTKIYTNDNSLPVCESYARTNVI